DKQEIESKMDALTGILHELSSILYQKAQQSAPGESASGGEPPAGEPKKEEERKKKGPGDEDIIDADYKVKE
ncbi:MAG: molecular chaperone DnaK, partial [Candidatus Brocadiales bacterium]|nr:molecular chaperone DnaK [Candidatus Brocadiales bacterium]